MKQHMTESVLQNTYRVVSISAHPGVKGWSSDNWDEYIGSYVQDIGALEVPVQAKVVWRSQWSEQFSCGGGHGDRQPGLFESLTWGESWLRIFRSL